jgi:hypothetical protein
VSDEHRHQGTVTAISSRVIEALPNSMLLMLLLNVCFIGALFWLLSSQNASREKVIIMLLESCAKTVPLEAFPSGLMVAPLPPKKE